MQLENEKLIKQFLFGEMPEEERFEFEERFITDADLFEQIKASEDELIEKYVRGWMNSAERTEFEKFFLTTVKRRERVEFSRQMFNKIDDQKEKAIPVKKNDGVIAEESIWQKLGGLFLSPKIAMATAFAVLITVFGSWFLYKNLNNKNPEFVKNQDSNATEVPKQTFSPTPKIPSAESPQKTEDESNESTESAVNNSPEQVNNSNGETIKVPNKIPTPKNQKKEKNKTPVPPPNHKVQENAPNPVLTLFAGTLRSSGKNNVLNLAANPKTAMLRLNLESINYKTYRAEITDADGRVVFQSENLKSKTSIINLPISAKNLKQGDYMVKLYGENDLGRNESVADFQFRVNR